MGPLGAERAQRTRCVGLRHRFGLRLHKIAGPELRHQDGRVTFSTALLGLRHIKVLRIYFSDPIRQIYLEIHVICPWDL